LIYAAGEAEDGVHEVTGLGKRLRIASLDPSGRPDEILARVDRLACLIRNVAYREAA
jgi:hypothetical protein